MHSLLNHVYFVADGLKFHMQKAREFLIQNLFYNEWTHVHFDENVLLFAPSWSVILFDRNVKGSFHESTIAHWGNVYS